MPVLPPLPFGRGVLRRLLILSGFLIVIGHGVPSIDSQNTLQVTRYSTPLGARPGRVVSDHPAGLPVPGAHHVGGRRAPARQRSAACENQAFQVGRNVIALQFHMETTPAGVEALVEHCRNELVPGPYVQSEHNLLGAPPERYTAINHLMQNLLAYLLA